MVASYLKIYDWMIKELQLRGSELIIYALLYATMERTQREITQKDIVEYIGISRQQVYKILDKLIQKGLIEKRETFKKNVFYICKQSLHGDVNKVDIKCKQSLHGDVNKVDMKRKQSLHEDVNKVDMKRKQSLHEDVNKVDNHLYNIYNNISSSSTTTTRACTRACVRESDKNFSSDIESYKRELETNQSCCETLCMRFHLTRDELQTYIGNFCDEIQFKGTEHRDRNDFRRHFFDWLRIQIEYKLKVNNNATQNTTINTNSYGENEEQQRQRLQGYAAVAAEFRQGCSTAKES